MKKMGLAVALMFAVAMAFVTPVKAQNQPASITLGGVGVPQVLLNDNLSNWGQVYNIAGQSVGAWALGAGSSSLANGTGVVYWNASSQVGVGTTIVQASSSLEVGSLTAFRVKKNGWTEYHFNTAPTISSCGGSQSAASGADQAGDVTLGAAAVTSCTVTFNQAPSNIPHCWASNRTSKLVAIAQPTATTMVIVGTGASAPFGNANDVIDWGCNAHN